MRKARHHQLALSPAVADDHLSALRLLNIIQVIYFGPLFHILPFSYRHQHTYIGRYQRCSTSTTPYVTRVTYGVIVSVITFPQHAIESAAKLCMEIKCDTLCMSVCVCVYACHQDIWNNCWRIWTIFCEMIGLWPRSNRWDSSGSSFGSRMDFSTFPVLRDSAFLDIK